MEKGESICDAYFALSFLTVMFASFGYEIRKVINTEGLRMESGLGIG